VDRKIIQIQHCFKISRCPRNPLNFFLIFLSSATSIENVCRQCSIGLICYLSSESYHIISYLYNRQCPSDTNTFLPLQIFSLHFKTLSKTNIFTKILFLTYKSNTTSNQASDGSSKKSLASVITVAICTCLSRFLSF
jgi:hypothetical protein